MQRRVKRWTGGILLAGMAGLLAFGEPGRLVQWWQGRHSSPYVHYPSPMPQPAPVVAVRFDPSYYYSGQRPGPLAADLAARWQAAGVKLVFYRAYDPRHGAFYRTRHPLNREGDYGRFGLLEAILESCHKRGIRVFAWMPVLNHSGAWEAHPEWRSRAADGTDHTETGLEFALCARQQGVQGWWGGFLEDFLERYPEIDGVDLGEPVLSWTPGAACHCAACAAAVAAEPERPAEAVRAEALIALVRTSIEVIHSAGKTACLTTVQTAAEDGRLHSFEEQRRLMGLDLAAVLAAESAAAPDLLCPEFLWQDMKSRYGDPGHDGESIFRPEWTEGAVREFMARLDRPMQVIAHVEITDFPGAPAGPEELRRSLAAAVRGGAEGLDVYDCHQLDDEGGWEALAAALEPPARARCLVLHDGGAGLGDAVQTGELLRHFEAEVELAAAADYQPRMLDRFDHLFYVGTDAEATLPESFLDDLETAPRLTVCWLGFSIDQALARPALAARFGLEYLGAAEQQINRVHYKGAALPKEDPWTVLVKPVPGGPADVLAQGTGQAGSVPYALRSGRRTWFFADVPSSFAVEGGRFLVFADLLHEIMGQDHAERQLAMVRIEDVHPLSDPIALRTLADLLHDEDVPFQVALVPFYTFPEMDATTSIAGQPALAEAIRHMVRRGGTVVLHGVTHQRFGETTADFEFWDPVSDTPPDGQSAAVIRDKLHAGLRECWRAGIYPLMWETPHYAGSQRLYEEVSRIFSLAMERRQAVDRTGTDQYVPYVIPRDRFGQVIVPENLGYVPLDDARAEVITHPARNMRVVRDGVASFFFHPFIEPAVLRDILRTMKRDGFTFTNVAGLPVRVETPFGVVTNEAATLSLAPPVAAGEARTLRFPGYPAREEQVFADNRGTFAITAAPAPGDLHAVQFINPYDAEGETARDAGRGADALPVRVVANPYGDACMLPQAMLLDSQDVSGWERSELEGFARILEVVGIGADRVEVERFDRIAEGINLVIVPAAAMERLNDEQTRLIVEAVSAGRVQLLASGFGPLSDELGIAGGDKTLNVTGVRDLFYDGIEIRWREAAQVRAFDAPADAGFFYEDAASGQPLVVGSRLGEGRYLFLGAPLCGAGGRGVERYPYLLTHLFSYLGFYPLVRQSEFEVYFNPAERSEDTAVEDLIKHWRRSGVRAIYVAGWQQFPEWSYDYARLIELAHENAMLVYAWLELPFVSERFWLEHPEWRERNALGEEAVVDWLKPMALADPACLAAVRGEMRSLVEGHDFDGVVLNRLGWVSEGGPADPASYTPLGEAARTQFQAEAGFDPMELFDAGSGRFWGRDPASFERFERWRASAALSMLETIVDDLEAIREARPGLEIVLTWDGAHLNSGIALEDLPARMADRAVTLQYAPPAGREWEPAPEGYLMQRVFVAAREGNEAFVPGAPSTYPTGLALYDRLRRMTEEHQRFSLLSESSIHEVDMHLLPFIGGAGSRVRRSGEGMIIEAPHSGEALLAGMKMSELLLDDTSAGSFWLNRIIVPVGAHKVGVNGHGAGTLSRLKAEARLADFSADLLGIELTPRGLTIAYRSDRRAHAVLNQRPRTLHVDGHPAALDPVGGLRGWAVALPPGEHSATFLTRGRLDLALVWLSLLLSNGIVLISLAATILLATIFLLTIWKSRRRLKAEAVNGLHAPSP